MRDSRNSSTAVRPSMMHARSSQLNKRLQSMKASEDASTTAGGGGGRGSGGGGRGGRGGRRSSNSNSNFVNRGSASNSRSATSSGNVSDAFGAGQNFMAAAADSNPVPWTEHIDPVSGKPYWYDAETREKAQWPTPPPDDAVASQARKSHVQVRRKTKHRVGRGLSVGAGADGSESDSDAESNFI